MWQKIVVLTVIFAALLGHAAADYFVEEAEQLPLGFEQNCTKPGFQCKSCTEVWYCELMPDGTYEGTIADTCQPGQTCSDVTSTCTTGYNERCDPSIDNYKFVCQQPGVFPHPFDCKKYHICTAAASPSTPLDCPRGFGFDPRTLLCSIRLSVKQCSNPVKPCRALGQGPIPGNARMYHTCRRDATNATDTNLYPFLSVCTGDLVYVDTRCQDPALPQNVVDGKCTAKGLFYHPNCRSYNDCSGVGAAPVVRACAAGLYFDVNTDKCVAFGCELVR